MQPVAGKGWLEILESVSHPEDTCSRIEALQQVTVMCHSISHPSLVRSRRFSLSLFSLSQLRFLLRSATPLAPAASPYQVCICFSLSRSPARDSSPSLLSLECLVETIDERVCRGLAFSWHIPLCFVSPFGRLSSVSAKSSSHWYRDLLGKALPYGFVPRSNEPERHQKMATPR